MDYVTLSNGDPMPMVGFGVFQITDAKQCEKAALDALDAGYRHIDTAQAYGNEEAVGNAIAASGIDKEEVFVTTKVWVSNAGYENALRSIEESRKKLKKPYIDMVLIHQPFGDYYGTYRAMEELYRMGRVKAIGVPTSLPTGSWTSPSMRTYPQWLTRWRHTSSTSRRRPGSGWTNTAAA